MSKYSPKTLQFFLRRLSSKILRPNMIFAGMVTALTFSLFFQTAVAAEFETDSGYFDLKKPNANKNARNFSIVLESLFNKRGLKKEAVCDETDAVSNRVLREYGSIFVVSEKVSSPSVCFFPDHEAVESFQKSVSFSGKMFEGFYIELQPAALESLLMARSEAAAKRLKITPRDGAEAARRSYADTLRLWKSRFDPGCKYWKNRGKLTAEQVEHLKSLPVKEQVKETLELEKHGIYFSTNFNYSILQSVAAPGTSQHLSMLAFDVNEYENAEVRRILARYGWYRTIRNDVPHFTYLGHKENELRNYGLKKVTTRDGEFWLANLS